MKKSVNALADEIFALIQEDQGFGFISDGLGGLKSEKELFTVIRGALKHTELAAKKIRAWLKKYNQLEKKKAKRRYCYEIICKYKEIGVTGWCWGEDGKKAVLAEDPGSTFRRISQKEYEKASKDK